MIRLNEAMDPWAGPEGPELDLDASIECFFAPDGILASGHRLEHRPQQQDMAHAVIAAMQNDQPLFFEAGTGVGKSLAYLLPGILKARTSERPFIVSTNTKALQQQIEGNDLPLCRTFLRSLPEFAPLTDFRHAVLMGRANYLCSTRLEKALATRNELFDTTDQRELRRIADWAQSSPTGLLSELDPPPRPRIWDWLHADAHSCNSRNCHPEKCPFQRARAAVRNAHVVIVNHHLFFALLAAGQSPSASIGGILLPRDFVVLDEAHCVPAVATDYFGRRISQLGLHRQLQKLVSGPSKRPRGLLRQLQAGTALRRQVRELGPRIDLFFSSLRDQFLSKGRPFRLREPGCHPNELDQPLASLIAGLDKLKSRLPEGYEHDELLGIRSSLQNYREGLTEVLQIADPDSVYWLETTGGNPTPRVHLRSAPLSVAAILRQRLFNRKTSVLLTSATLAEKEGMDSFKERVGAPEAPARQVASPFDYPLQTEILLYRDAPEPSAGNKRLDIRFLTSEISRLITEIKGGSLVLFTSYRDLESVYAGLIEPCRLHNRPLLRQQEATSRDALLRRMREAGKAILLGTDSFWTGVDIPGPALSQVIITRIPFENPTHPIAEARAERCRAEGRQPFYELTLPAALTKFRQGCGRLIRCQSDEGRLVIMDSRLLTKSYGHLFLQVLPHHGYRIRRSQS